MRKRAQDMSGNFEIVSANDKGTTATLRMRFAQQGPNKSETAVHAGGASL
jgi:hypothetical protein